jgi:hypothetical protein
LELPEFGDVMLDSGWGYVTNTSNASACEKRLESVQVVPVGADGVWRKTCLNLKVVKELLYESVHVV